MSTTYVPRASTVDPSIVFDSIATERVRYLGYQSKDGDHQFSVTVTHRIDGETVERAEISAVMDDTTFFMTEGRTEETVAAYVEWKTGGWENNGRKLAALIAVTELAPLRVWSMPD